MARKDKIYTVSQVNSFVRSAIEDCLPPRMTVSGEITDWKRHYASGHCYFSLKDSAGQLPCIMWKSKYEQVKFDPENGLQVLAKGYVDVYAPQGKYQFYAENLQLSGDGSLQAAFEKMVQKLQQDGLFDAEHKKAIPKYPMKIGIVTSESGAAFKDIADSIFNRWPCAALVLFPVRVQGEGASNEIASMLRRINKQNKRYGLDVCIIGRGGGSLEDLWAFNEEVVARAIFDSSIPIISAVGHEIDVTVADLVADARASTPTKAGMIAVPDRTEVLDRISTYRRQLNTHIMSVYSRCSQTLKTILASFVFRNPLSLCNESRQQVDDFAIKLESLLKKQLFEKTDKVRGYQEKIAGIEPHRVVASKREGLSVQQQRLHGLVSKRLSDETAKVEELNHTVKNCFKNRKHTLDLKLTGLEHKMGALDPKSVLNRGYSITTRKATGGIITSKDDIKAGETLVTELSEKKYIESIVKKA